MFDTRWQGYARPSCIKAVLSMSDIDLRRFRFFCNRTHSGPVLYSMMPEISGPLIDGRQSTVSCQFWYNHVTVEIRKDAPHYGWGYIFAQEVCRTFSVFHVEYDFRKLTCKQFLGLNPYGVSLNTHRRVLDCLPNKSSPLYDLHKTRIDRYEYLLREYRSTAKSLLKDYVPITPPVAIEQPVEASADSTATNVTDDLLPF